MVLSIKEIIEIIKNKDKESIKQITSIIMENLEKTNLMVWERWNFKMEIFMKENLLIIYSMVKESTYMEMEISTLGSG